MDSKDKARILTLFDLNAYKTFKTFTALERKRYSSYLINIQKYKAKATRSNRDILSPLEWREARQTSLIPFETIAVKLNIDIKEVKALYLSAMHKLRTSADKGLFNKALQSLRDYDSKLDLGLEAL